MAGRSTEVLVIIPVREKDAFPGGQQMLLSGKPLLSYTVEAAKASNLVSRILVSTDGEAVAEFARHLGAEVPFLRPSYLARDDVPLVNVLRHCLDWLQVEQNYSADVVVMLEISHPLRPSGLIDQVIETLVHDELDTVFTAFESHHVFWRVGNHGVLDKLGFEEDCARSIRGPIYGQLSGLVCATRTVSLRDGRLIGTNVGIVPVRGLVGLLDLQEPDGIQLAEYLLERQPSKVHP